MDKPFRLQRGVQLSFFFQAMLGGYWVVYPGNRGKVTSICWWLPQLIRSLLTPVYDMCGYGGDMDYVLGKCNNAYEGSKTWVRVVPNMVIVGFVESEQLGHGTKQQWSNTENALNLMIYEVSLSKTETAAEASLLSSHSSCGLDGLGRVGIRNRQICTFTHKV